MALDGALRTLFDILTELDASGQTYEEAIAAQEQAVADAQARLDTLLSLEGLSKETTTRSPSGRKLRRDRGKPRKQRQTTEAPDPKVEYAEQVLKEGL